MRSGRPRCGGICIVCVVDSMLLLLLLCQNATMQVNGEEVPGVVQRARSSSSSSIKGNATEAGDKESAGALFLGTKN